MTTMKTQENLFSSAGMLLDGAAELQMFLNNPPRTTDPQCVRLIVFPFVLSTWFEIFCIHSLLESLGCWAENGKQVVIPSLKS